MLSDTLSTLSDRCKILSDAARKAVMSVFSTIGAYLAKRLGEASTINGLAAAVGAGVGLATGVVTWPLAIPMLVGAAVAILIPQNPNRQAIVQGATLAVEIATGKTTTIPFIGKIS